MNGIIPYALLNSVKNMVASLGSGFTVKGVVTATSNLPESGTLGDLYLVSGEGYASYIWDGSAWQLKDGDVATDADITSALYT